MQRLIEFIGHANPRNLLAMRTVLHDSSKLSPDDVAVIVANADSNFMYVFLHGSVAGMTSMLELLYKNSPKKCADIITRFMTKFPRHPAFLKSIHSLGYTHDRAENFNVVLQFVKKHDDLKFVSQVGILFECMIGILDSVKYSQYRKVEDEFEADSAFSDTNDDYRLYCVALMILQGLYRCLQQDTFLDYASHPVSLPSVDELCSAYLRDNLPFEIVCNLIPVRNGMTPGYCLSGRAYDVTVSRLTNECLQALYTLNPRTSLAKIFVSDDEERLFVNLVQPTNPFNSTARIIIDFASRLAQPGLVKNSCPRLLRHFFNGEGFDDLRHCDPRVRELIYHTVRNEQARGKNFSISSVARSGSWKSLALLYLILGEAKFAALSQNKKLNKKLPLSVGRVYTEEEFLVMIKAEARDLPRDLLPADTRVQQAIAVARCSQ